MSNLIFIIIAALVITYCGYNFAQAVANLDRRISNQIAEASK